ncbi:arabinogalactan endo-1,4-beta-galactosidase [Cohnella fermenti]|uniref:Arabinogalactan endo-beta-1,4-galactanase n=2 Tax=Cohnella fermenti TaxID=2565925 RepID=A0A4S4BVB3_9BACL|nr:arabinogalactan endo-1,4-beta-galactosidase [Cohnella fermenti]
MMLRKRLQKTATAVLAAAILLGGSVNAPAPASAEEYDDFIRGVDVSMLSMVEDLGGQFYSDNVEGDALEILHDNGANYVRLKLWVDPYDANGNPYGGGTNDFETTLALAKRADALGMGILINFHLSDWWTDPAKQIKPKAWVGLSFSSLKTTLYNYMKNTLDDFADEGIIPDMIQVGNEIPTGILHTDGKVGDGNDDFSDLAELLGSAIDGVRDSAASNAKIILHLDHGGDNGLYLWWFGNLLAADATLDFDIIGLSFYPMWHGTMSDLQYNLNDISKRYDKDVLIVETAYAYTLDDGDGAGNVFISGDENIAGYPATPQGQFDFMNDLESIILNVPDSRGLGYFYWEPTWLPVEDAVWGTAAGVAYANDSVTPTNTWDNLTLFDFDGNALSSMNLLNEPTPNLLTNPSFEADGYTNTPSGWNVWLPSGVSATTVKTESSYAFDGDYKLTFWNSSSYSGSIYKTFTGLENGTYSFSVWAMTNGDQTTLQLYAKNYGGAELNTTIGTSDINWNLFTIDNIVVTNGTCEIGIYTVAGANDWLNLDKAMFRKVE